MYASDNVCEINFETCWKIKLLAVVLRLVGIESRSSLAVFARPTHPTHAARHGYQAAAHTNKLYSLFAPESLCIVVQYSPMGSGNNPFHKLPQSAEAK